MNLHSRFIGLADLILLELSAVKGIHSPLTRTSAPGMAKRSPLYQPLVSGMVSPVEMLVGISERRQYFLRTQAGLIS